MKTAKAIEIEKPLEKFRKAMRQILSVPKAELLKREEDYQREKRSKDTKREK